MESDVLAALALAALVGSSQADQCATSDNVKLSPAEMLDKEEAFRNNLPPADHERLDAVLPRNINDRIGQCANRDGASCDAAAYVRAFNKLGMMPRFLKTICHRPDQASWNKGMVDPSWDKGSNGNFFAFAGIIGTTEASLEICGSGSTANRQAIVNAKNVAERRSRQLGVSQSELASSIESQHVAYLTDHEVDPQMPDCALLNRQMVNLVDWTTKQQTALLFPR